MRKTIQFLVLFAILAVLAFGCSVFRDAPKSQADLEAMPQAEYDSWRGRTTAWTVFVTGVVLRDHPEARDEVQAFGELLKVLASQPAPPASGALTDAAAQAGLSPTLTALLVMELQAMLEARGGLPSGPRGNEVLGALGQAILDGAATPP